MRGKTRKDHVRTQVIQEDAKVWTGSYRGREEGGGLDRDGSTTTEKI